MFACIYAPGIENARHPDFLKLCYSFAPLLEETDLDTIIFDIGGSEPLFGPPSGLPSQIATAATKCGLAVQVAVASNPDAALHAARGFREPVFIPPGMEGQYLQELPIEFLSRELAQTSEEKFREILQILSSWGIHRFGEFASLPGPEISERLGPEGLHLHKMASGTTIRSAIPKIAAHLFSQTIDLEHPVALLEPLFFIFARLLKNLCGELLTCGLVASGLLIRLKLAGDSECRLVINLPLPLSCPKTLFKIVELELSANLPPAPVTAIELSLEPVPARAIQQGLFDPKGPEPEKFELTSARIAKILGSDKIGSPTLLDSHCPDSFRIKRFQAALDSKKRKFLKSPTAHKIPGDPPIRILRPPLLAKVWINQNQPARLHAPVSGIRNGIAGNIISLAGPWRGSGNWWTPQPWHREEWDVQLESGILCRIYRELQKNQWFIDAIYD